MENNTQMKEKKAFELAEKVVKLAASSCIIAMRFLDSALSKLNVNLAKGYFLPFCDGENLTLSPLNLLDNLSREKAYAKRLYIHVLFHFIFSQPYSYSKIIDEKRRELFSLACDIAIENVVFELELEGFELSDDYKRQEKIRVLKKYNERITAQGLYRYFLANELSIEGKEELLKLFTFDDHKAWMSERLDISLAQWQKILERVRADLQSFSKNVNASEGLSENLTEAARDRYDYSDILKRFAVMNENIGVNDEEFDYIYYTYGMSLLGDTPLVEPLEYREDKKVKEFAIVLDTSASCQGNLIKSFLNKTYSILKSHESFHSQINVHIIMCDNAIQSDIKITDELQFEEFLKNGKLTGFGGTDFRPAFEYVDKLVAEGEFTNLKGLIYFTDGYGIYPLRMPQYESMFVFVSSDKERLEVPSWAIKVELLEDDL